MHDGVTGYPRRRVFSARELEIVRDGLLEHVKALTVDIGPRTPFIGNSLARAAAYIQSAFENAGLSVREQPYQYHGQRVVNLLATAPATTGATAYYVVGAHYDTVATTPGADDNASAVAVMLELARRVPEANLKAPVLFAAFTLEEPPAFWTDHQGSRVFARACRSKGDSVLGALILEMVGYTSPRQHYPFVSRWPGYPAQGNFIGIVGNWPSRRFGGAVLRGFRNNRGLPVESLFLPFDGWILPATRLSDHASFWDAGWPALMVTDTAFFRNPHYHLPSDRIDTLDFSFMAQLVESLELALFETPVRPTGMIVLFTDSGLDGPYAGQMKAVPPQIGPGITVIRTLADVLADNRCPPVRHPARDRLLNEGGVRHNFEMYARNTETRTRQGQNITVTCVRRPEIDGGATPAAAC